MKTILPKILLGLLILTTLAGSIWFFAQNSSANKTTPSNNNTSTNSKETASTSSDSTNNSSTPNSASTQNSEGTANTPSAPTTPTTQNTPSNSNTSTTPSTPAKVSNSNNCIITISGQKYDVTELLTTHSGGNIFKCGQDNTSIFFSQHNQRWLDSRVARYKVN